jgi:hypothetical protein
MPSSGQLVAVLAAAYGFLFAFAGLGKVDGWRSWTQAINGFLPTHTRIAAVARVTIPLAEAGVAALCIAFPRLGLVAASSVLAAFGVIVAFLQAHHRGAECNCFGAVASSRISKALVLRDLSASGIALAAVLLAWSIRVPHLASAELGVLVLLGSLLLVALEFRTLRRIDVRRLENIDVEA